ncbi:hypothetical protein FS749_000244 [Ceratobasidium sp. UAMH 11750]|nr:hypothetical protein FS749_000244 [Ceratobasidium sp. UAMH 11750]
MFGSNVGTQVLKTTPAPSASVPVHWVASRDTAKGVVYLKVVNTATSQYAATFNFGFTVKGSTASAVLLTGPSLDATNSPSKQNNVVPKNVTVSVTGGNKLSYTLPASSVMVITLSI